MQSHRNARSWLETIVCRSLTAYLTGRRDGRTMTCSWRVDQTAFPSRQVLVCIYFLPFPGTDKLISQCQPTSSSKSPALEFMLPVLTAHPCPTSCSGGYYCFPLWTKRLENNRNTIQIVHEWSLVVACYKRRCNTLVD